MLAIASMISSVTYYYFSFKQTLEISVEWFQTMKAVLQADIKCFYLKQTVLFVLIDWFEVVRDGEHSTTAIAETHWKHTKKLSVSFKGKHHFSPLQRQGLER